MKLYAEGCLATTGGGGGRGEGGRGGGGGGGGLNLFSREPGSALSLAQRAWTKDGVGAIIRP